MEGPPAAHGAGRRAASHASAALTPPTTTAFRAPAGVAGGTSRWVTTVFPRCTAPLLLLLYRRRCTARLHRATSPASLSHWSALFTSSMICFSGVTTPSMML